MTPTQIAAVIAATGEAADSTLLLKFVRCGSGAVYSFQSAPGKPGRYTAVFDDANELLVLSPINPDSTVSGLPPSEMISYDSIEAVAFWPEGTAL